MNLTYKKDFWSFYNSNREGVEAIVGAACNRYASLVDPEDMHSELLLRLAKSSFLRRFNPDRSQLNSYLTATVRGYALHVVNDKRYQPEGSGLYRLPVADMNYIPETAPEMSFLRTLPSTEDSLDYTALVSELRQSLTPRARKLFDMKFAGYTHNEIAGALHLSRPHISLLSADLKKTVKANLSVGVSAHV